MAGMITPETPYELDVNYDNLAGTNRMERALDILKKPHDIVMVAPNTYTVKSQRGFVSYLVTEVNGEWKCTCPDHITNHNECKHILAVKEYLKRKEYIHKKKDTTKAPRDWHNYTLAQMSEGELFPILLRQLVSLVNEPPHKTKKGVSLADRLFMSITKVATQLSSRRAYHEMNKDTERDYNYNTVNIFLNRPEITPLLRELVQMSAYPLVQLEENFALDASGFGTTNFGDWMEEKWGDSRKHDFIKCHMACGVVSNIVTDAVITDKSVGDMNVLPDLLDGTTGRFKLYEVYADAGYLSNDNYDYIAKQGAKGYIWFKGNVTGKGCPAWVEAYGRFINHREDFEEHYGKRNNAETVYSSIKTKFGEKLKSKNLTAQINELYCKVIAYNITVVIRMAFEKNIKVTFE